MCIDSNKYYQCPVCGSSEIFTMFKAQGWEENFLCCSYKILSCRSCHVSFTKPDSGDLSKLYSEGLYSNKGNRFAGIINLVQYIFQWERFRYLAKCSTVEAKLLDVGCGKGRFMEYAASRGWDIYGVEPSQSSRNLAIKRVGNRVFEHISDIPEIKFDAITLWHVLEHVQEPVNFLLELRKYLKPDGFVLISVPNLDSLQSKIGKGLWMHLDLPRHRFHFTPKSLQEVLSRAGYRVLSVKHFSLEFGPIGYIQTFLNLIGCEPGLIYKIIKHNFTPVNQSKLAIYNIVVILVALPVLIPISILLSILEAALKRGGAILVRADINPKFVK